MVGVAVGATDVLVLVGVAVGGTGVAVGPPAVDVAVGATEVFVRVGAVGGAGVLVGPGVAVAPLVYTCVYFGDMSVPPPPFASTSKIRSAQFGLAVSPISARATVQLAVLLVLE